MKLKWLAYGSTVLTFCLALGWVYHHESDFFAISKNPVSLEFEKSHESLLTLIKPELESKMSPLKGQSIWRVSLGSLKNQLETLPWIQKVSMGRRFPNTIETRVVLEEIAMIFMDQKKRFFPILKSGKVLQAHKSKWLPSAPILRNNNIFKNSEKLERTIQLYEELPSMGPLQRENIAGIDFDDVTGLSLHLINEDVLVHFGVEDMQTKALQVVRVLDYLKSQKQKARVIDASFTKKVLVRPRKRF